MRGGQNPNMKMRCKLEDSGWEKYVTWIEPGIDSNGQIKTIYYDLLTSTSTSKRLIN